MGSFLIRRIGYSALLLIVVSLIIFTLVRVLPGDPVVTRLGAVAAAGSEEVVAQLRSELGLDKPLFEQYVAWLLGALQGDFGVSYSSQYPVSALIAQRVPATVELAVAAIVIAILIAVPLSVASTIRPGSLLDKASSGLVTLGMAIPQFWLGILLVTIFSVSLRLLPARGYVEFGENPVGNLTLLILPAVTLGVTLAAPLMRFLRSSLAEVSSSLYMRTAEGKGLRWGAAVVRHALPNALMPTLTFFGLLVGQLLGGVVLVEYVFGWPGLGSLTVSAISSRDYGVLQGVVLLLSAVFIIINLLVDIAYGLLNPRIRVGAA